MKVLVTGGCGFIGSHLVDALVERGDEVVVYDNLFSGNLENIQSAIDVGAAKHVWGDVRDLYQVKKSMVGVEVVFHQAAVASVARSIDDPFLTTTVNVNGTLNILVAAREAGAKRVVFASSSSVYGDTNLFPEVETDGVRPLSPYAASKAAGEMYCRAFTKSFGLETVCLRYFNVFGTRQDPKSEYAAVIPRFITALLRGERPIVYGDGEQSRDFCYVGNVVAANLLAATVPGISGHVYNIAGGETHSLKKLLAVLGKHLGVDPHPVWASARAGDPRKSHAMIFNAVEELGYRVRTSFEAGLESAIGWYKAQEASQRPAP